MKQVKKVVTELDVTDFKEKVCELTGINPEAYNRKKSLKEIQKEVKIHESGCMICEGGGWSSKGTKFTYKNYFCII